MVVPGGATAHREEPYSVKRNPERVNRHLLAYRGRMRGLLVYSGLRIALFLGVWLPLQLLTPLRGLLALVVAILASGVIGFFLLDRPRDEASAAVWRVFRRIDDRIQRNALIEDSYAEATLVEGPAGTEVLSVGREEKSQAEEESVDQGEHAGELQHPHQVSASGTLDDVEGGAHGERK